MIAVPVTHKGLEVAIRTLQKKLMADGVFRELRDRDKGRRERDRLKAARARKRRKQNAYRLNNRQER